jgi:ABC-type lipoprotein release transport system permease subunit
VPEEAGQRSGSRAASYVVALAWRRVRRRSSGALLAASGIAIGTAVLVGVLAGTKVAQDRSVSQAVQQIPAASRSVRAVWFGVPVGGSQAYPSLDRQVRSRLGAIRLPGPTPIVLFRESTVAGHFVSLAGVDGLARYVHLTGGRLPRACTPARCEVLRLRGAGTLPSAPGLRLVQVGTGTLRTSQLFGDFLAPTDNALEDRELAPALQQSAGYHRPKPAPLVVAEGIEPLTRAAATANTYRSYAWVWPLAAGQPRLWQIDDLVGASERTRVALSSATSGFSVQAPVEELRAAERAATTAGRRLLLVGGEAAALLFAFAVLAARTMRRDLEAARRRLTWYGARRWHLRLLTLTESALVALVGTVVGWLVGVLVGALAAARVGAPVGAVLRESVFAPAGLGLAACVVLAATIVVAAATSLPVREGGRFGPLDAAALGAVALVVAALAGGAADQSADGQGQGSGLVLLLLPGLIAFAAAVAAARLFGPLVRLCGRLLHRSVGARLAAITLGRGPGAAAVTVAFLTLAFALALLAEGYRATLVQAEGDQAAFAVPLDVAVREGFKTLVPVLDAAPLSRYAAIAGGTEAVPIVRLRASAGSAEGLSGVTVLGLPAAKIAAVHGWRGDFADRSRSSLAADVTAPAGSGLRGITLGSRLAFVAGPGVLSLSAIVEGRDGRFAFLELGPLDARKSTRIDRALPARLRGGILLGLQLVPPRLVDRGADAGRPLAGHLLLTGLGAQPWLGVGGVRADPAGGGVELTYRISQQDDAIVRVRQATDASPPEVLVTPRLGVLAGGTGGLLPLQIGGGTVPVRVAGIVDHFPGTTGDAVVGDIQSLQTAVNTRVPGAGRVNEIWLASATNGTDAAMAALARPPFQGVEAVSRDELLAQAHDDPLGHGTLIALDAAAIVALLLAALGLALTVLSDLRDDRGDLYDLEAQGAEPSLLRRIVRVRALVVGVAGVLSGAVAGAVLALLVTRVVAVTAHATTVDLPLRTAFDLRVVAVGAIAYLLVAAALVALSTRRAFRADRGPKRAQELGT